MPARRYAFDPFTTRLRERETRGEVERPRSFSLRRPVVSDGGRSAANLAP